MELSHEKLFVTSMAFTQKTNGNIKNKLISAREKALIKIQEYLVEKNPLQNVSFSWFCGSEYYGEYDNIEVIINKIDKNYNCVEFDIIIPKIKIMGFKEVAEDEIIKFYVDLFLISIKKAITKFSK